CVFPDESMTHHQVSSCRVADDLSIVVQSGSPAHGEARQSTEIDQMEHARSGIEKERVRIGVGSGFSRADKLIVVVHTECITLRGVVKPVIDGLGPGWAE